MLPGRVLSGRVPDEVQGRVLPGMVQREALAIEEGDSRVLSGRVPDGAPGRVPWQEDRWRFAHGDGI